MKFIEQFPTTAMFLAFFAMSCIFAYCGTITKLGIIGITLLLLLLNVFKVFSTRSALRTGFTLTLSACLAAGILSFIFFDILANDYEAHHEESDTVTLQIIECDYTLSYAARYEAIIRESEILPKGTHLLLDTSMTSLADGTLLSGEVTYIALSESGTDSFDSVHYYLPKKIMIMAEDVSLAESGFRNIFSPTGFFEEINAKLSAMILAHVRYDAGGMAAAVLLGNKDSLTDSVMRDFRRIGISHLLVVSGTHFSVIVSFAERAMRKLRVNRRIRAGANMIIVVFIMFLTGFTSSVIRAGIMHLLAQFSLIISRKTNMTNSFAISGTLMILTNPYSAMDCSLQLSFIATYSCIIFLQNRGSVFRAIRNKTGIRRRNRLVRALFGMLETILMTSLITLNTLPLMWLYFGEISLISIPVNVIFIPLVTVLMYLTGLYLLLYPLRIFLFPMASLLNGYCTILEKLAGYFSAKDWIMLPLNYSFTIFLLIPLTVLLVALPFCSKTLKKRVLLSVCGICLILCSVIGIVNLADRQNVYLSYVPEKKNDGFVLKSEGKALICEISDASFGYSYNLTNEVSELHCCEIEALLLTHYHNKHIQLLERLSQCEILRGVVLPEPIDEREDGIYRSLCETAELYGISVTTVPCGGSFIFGNTEITLFERTYLSRSTHPITALEIDMNGETAVIASGSFNQSVTAITESLESADFPILGRHSPVYKKVIDLSFDSPKAVVISEQAYEWISESTLDSADQSVIIRQPDRLRLKINRDDKVSISAELIETP